MMVNLYNQAGEVIGETALPDKVFGLKFNPGLVHQVLTGQLANARAVIAHTKGRGEVRGGGRKPWRQKGTGRARHASIRSPIWKGGGVTFGPTKQRNFRQKINKRMRRQALAMMLSAKLRDRELLLLDALQLDQPKTKLASQVLTAVSRQLEHYRLSRKQRDRVLLVTPHSDHAVRRAAGNLSWLAIKPADSLALRELLENKYLIMLKAAVPVLEQTYKI